MWGDIGVVKKVHIIAHCATHKGSREENEDSYLALVGESAPCGTLGFLAIADGIGGQGAGAQASRMAVKTMADVFAASCAIASSTMSDVPHLLRFSAQKANAALCKAQTENQSLEGMGTTCVAAAVTGDAVHVVSVGDSRAYLFHDDRLILLTEDEWTKESDGITIVCRAVGWQPLLPTEPVSHPMRPSDRLLLCTDGLTDALSDESIQNVLASCDEDQVCESLIQSAVQKPDADNVTVVIARLVSGDDYH